MKKAIKITAIVVAAILAIIIIIPLALRGKIDEIVKREASAMLTANLSFDKLGISLIKHFPNASLDLQGLSLVGTDKFEGDTLVSSRQISVVVNLMSLFSDSGFVVSKLILDRPSILAMKLSGGEANWDIMKPSESPETVAYSTAAKSQSSFSLSMKDVRIDGGRITYIDSLSDMSFYADDLTLRMQGDLSAVTSDIKLTLDAEDVYYVMGKVAMLKDADVELDMNVDADLATNKYTFKDNKIKLNAIQVAIDGWVAMKESSVEMDVKLNSSKVEFRELLSMIPAFYTKDFKNLSASGALTLSAWAKGELAKDKFPACEAVLNVDNGSFKYAALPQAVDNINIKASVANPGGSADNSVISVERLSMAIAGNVLSATLHATNPVSDMAFDGVAKGVVNLGAIKDVYPLGDSIKLSGVVTADVSVSGRMSQIEKKEYEKIKASGTFAIKGMTAELVGLPAIRIAQASASISPQALTLSGLQVNVGRSDISATGSLTNYLGYALRGNKLSGRLTVKSQLLDLNELMGDSSPESGESAESKSKEDVSKSAGAATAAKTSAFVVPKNLDLALNASVGKILFQKMTIANFVGALSVVNGTVDMNKLTMNALGGNMAATGSYSTAVDPRNPRLAMNLNISKCSFEQTFKELDMVKKIVPLFEKTGGDYSMKMDMTTLLNSEMSPELNTLSAKGVIESSNINIQNIKAFDELAAVLKNDKLKNIRTDDLKISFTIENGLIRTSPFDLKLGDVKLNLSGVTGLDQTIDYTAKVTMPKAVGGVLSNVNVKIGGTFSAPKITLDVKEMAQDALNNAISQGLDKLTGGKLSSGKSGDGDGAAGIAAGESVDKLREQAQAAGDKLIEAAKAEGDKLVEKASNPLAKLAAKKAAELMLKKAEEQAQKLLDAIPAQ